jgi:NAD(P)H-dependent FMN reductase
MSIARQSASDRLCEYADLGEEEPSVARIAIILGSTRPNRRGEPVANWVLEIASRRDDADFELVDLLDYPLPHLDEPLPPRLRQYEHDHTKAWAVTIAAFDGFVIVTPEYNSGVAGVLKNALDYLFEEWRNKAVGFVSYGSFGGVRAAEHLRLVAAELEMADVRQQVALSLFGDFDEHENFEPREHNIGALMTMLDQVVDWSAALAPLRSVQTAA